MHASGVRGAHTAAGALMRRERTVRAENIVDVEAVVAELRCGDAVVAAAAGAAVGHVHRRAAVVRRIQG